MERYTTELLIGCYLWLVTGIIVFATSGSYLWVIIGAGPGICLYAYFVGALVKENISLIKAYLREYYS